LSEKPNITPTREVKTRGNMETINNELPRELEVGEPQFVGPLEQAKLVGLPEVVAGPLNRQNLLDSLWS
jgi:hypothetical protein